MQPVRHACHCAMFFLEMEKNETIFLSLCNKFCQKSVSCRYAISLCASTGTECCVFPLGRRYRDRTSRANTSEVRTPWHEQLSVSGAHVTLACIVFFGPGMVVFFKRMSEIEDQVRVSSPEEKKGKNYTQHLNNSKNDTKQFCRNWLRKDQGTVRVLLPV